MIPTTPAIQRIQALTYTPVWAVPRSLAATRGIAFVFFSWGYLDVSVPLVRLIPLCIQRYDSCDIMPAGFPHSEISGSTVVCTSPRLIAACHALHRLLMPRHPPYALSNLTINYLASLKSSYITTSSSIFKDLIAE